MFDKKCFDCGKKIQKDFNFCPYCGKSFKIKKEENDFGMLGRNDFAGNEFEKVKMPFGLNKIVNSLMEQVEKDIDKFDGEAQKVRMPRGFQIQISAGMPMINRMARPKRTKKQAVKISDEELKRRAGLKKVEAKHVIKRIGDKVVYEIPVPGVNSREQVVVTKLENSMEIKAYSKDKCYCKTIPLKVGIIGFYVRDEKVVLEVGE